MPLPFALMRIDTGRAVERYSVRVKQRERTKNEKGKTKKKIDWPKREPEQCKAKRLLSVHYQVSPYKETVRRRHIFNCHSSNSNNNSNNRVYNQRMVAPSPAMSALRMFQLFFGGALVLLSISSTTTITVAFPVAPGLLDPDTQPKFVTLVPEILGSNTLKLFAPGQQTMLQRFLGRPAKAIQSDGVQLNAYAITQDLGLVNPTTQTPLSTPVFAYGTSQSTASYPGPTLEAHYLIPGAVQWANRLDGVVSHPFTSMDGRSVMDESLHWAYSLKGYQNATFATAGIPILTHLHGIHADPRYDGHPNRFFSPQFAITGPEWEDKDYIYPNDQGAATLWYHDHSLGVTRLNVYAGLVGYYIVRDEIDTGTSSNKLGLPAGEFEKAYAFNDRMFKENGELFFPAYPGDPFYADWITADMNWSASKPSCLGEYFGDFMLTNGKAWPVQKVQARPYRLHLLNGCDTRYLALSFIAVNASATTFAGGRVVPYTIVGADQGLMVNPIANITRSLLETGGRLDIVINFRGYEGRRIIIKNEGGDIAFRGNDLPNVQLFDHTNKIMAFDVDSRRLRRPPKMPNFDNPQTPYGPASKRRRVGLFEGRDQYGRLQPSLGGELIPGIVESFTWGEPNTEIVDKDATEDWIIYNFSSGAVRTLTVVKIVKCNTREFGCEKMAFAVEESGFVVSVCNRVVRTNTIGTCTFTQFYSHDVPSSS